MYHTSPLSGICATEHGYVASAGYDNQVILWEAKSHQPIAVGTHDHLANQVVFSDNAQLLASSSSDYSVRIWAVPSMALLSVLSHDDDVEGISFSPGNNLIATASRDRKVRVFTVEGRLVREFSGHENDVLTVEWLTESILVSCGDDSTLRYWDISTGLNRQTIDLGGMETDTLCVTASGKIISGNDDGELVYFDAEGAEIFRIDGHKAGIKRLVLNQNRVISLSYDRTFKIWSVNEDRLACQVEGEIPNVVWPRSCAFINDSQVAFVTFGDRYATYCIESNSWEVDSIQDTHGINAIYPVRHGYYAVGDAGIIRFNGEQINQVPSLCNFIVAENNKVLCGGQDGAVYDAESSEVIYQHHSPLNCCQVFTHEQGLFAAVGAYTGELILLKFLDDNELVYVASTSVHDNAIKDISVSHEQVFTVCADNSVVVMQFDEKMEMTPVLEGSHDKIVNGCASFKDSFVSVSRDLTLRIWGDEPAVLTTPHKNSIKCIATDDDSWIVSGDYRGTVSFYNVAEQVWYKRKVSRTGISAMAYDESRKVFMASSYDGSVHELLVQDLEGK